MINKIKNPLIRILFDYFSNHKLILSCSIICVLLTAVGNIAAPLILQQVINKLTSGLLDLVSPGSSLEVLEAGRETIWLQIMNLGFTLVACYAVSVTAGFTYSQINAVTGQKYMHELRIKLFSHMEDLPVKFFDQNDKGDIMSVYINDVDTVRQFIINSLSEILMFCCTFISLVIIMLISSIWLFLFVLAGFSLMVFVTFRVGGQSSRNFIAQQKLIGKQEGYVEEMMNGLKVIKSFCHEEESKEGFNKINKEFQQVATKANSFANILMPILGNIGNFLYVIVALIGTLFFIFKVPNLTITSFGATISIGVVVSFLPMVRQLTNSGAQMANQVNIIALAVGGCNRICKILDEAKEVDDGYVTLVRAKYDDKGNIVEANGEKDQTIWAWKHPHNASQNVTYTLLEGDIRMFDVDFGYNPNKIVLHDVSLYAKPGQKVAFVGSTGAGKTTITNLINRFYDIADGKIRYDGININKISKKDLRRSLGVVLQDVNLFTGTIMDNIRYGKLDATDEECIEAAKLANADSFITRLPQGYNTYLTNDGANLSQGQRQLLSIARAAVSNPPVMILDEATSSIDTRTEAIVTKAMDNLMNGRTVFVIAHRLSTIQNSDVIMVLDHGRIIERGTHDDLIKEKGVYYELYTGAFELE